MKKKQPAPSVAALKAERREQRKKLRAAMRSGVSGLRFTLAFSA